ncbi:MAG: fibronectin type III domain-containing protein [Chloroflexi bacterium]|nr:fibronectin type III domain-containing protein [Chloroflexota bacterium]
MWAGSDLLPWWPARLLAGALLAVLLALVLGHGTAASQDGPSVTGVAVTSAPQREHTYGPGETIRVTLTFSEAVDVTGEPRLAIDMDPADWGKKWAAYEDGSGTVSLTFIHTVIEPNYSSRGIAVLADSLELNGGTITSGSSQAGAALAHAGLDHNPNHRVDWQRAAPIRARSDVGADAVAGAPAIASGTPTLTSVTVVWTAPSSTGGEAITAYDLQYKESSSNSWTPVDDIWVTGGGALSYRQTGLTPSTGYDFQVRAVNASGDGAWSATRAATTGTPVISGTAPLSYAENSATRVGTFTVTGADEEVDEVTWAISGTDASHFDISTPKGALRLIDTSDTTNTPPRPKQPDYESPDDSGADGSYSITLTAAVGGVDATLAVTVALTDVDEPGAISLAPVRPKVGTALTATLSDPDTVSGTTTWAWQRSNGRNSWSTISGATSASYTPVAGDSGQYLRVTATYTDGHGANKSAEATAHHVVVASALTGLSATTTDSTLSLTPGFEADVLHYKVSCGDTDTMTVTPTAATGVRLAVDGVQTTSGTAVDVAVTQDSDVVVRASGADGGFTDYVVHCVHDFLANMSVAEEVSGGAMEELISWGMRDYVVIVDHHGVPRFRRAVGVFAGDPRFWFRFARVGANGDYRYSYGNREAGRLPNAIDATHFVLDEDFQRIATVSHVSPLTNTGVHDFRVLPNGNYLLMSYEDRVRRDLSAYGYDLSNFPHLHDWLSGTLGWHQDSGIQIVSPSRSSVFSWKSWGKLPYEDCTQHWADRYAHVNMVHYFEGTITASFRGCSKVLGINARNGNTQWHLGRTNLEPGQWESRRLGPEPLTIIGDPEGEFCGQHGAELHPGNRLTLFDNGEHCVVDPVTRESTRESGVYARAVEYALDLANGEAVFLWAKDQNDSKTLQGTRGGHLVVLDNGDWLISWARERAEERAGYGNVEKAITQVDPKTGTRKLAFDIPNPADTSVQANIRATPMPAYALAPQPVALSAAAPVNDRTSIFHRGDDDTPQVVVTFNRPVADFATTSPSLSVSGGTVTAVSALVANGEPANAYLFTLDPAGKGAVTLNLLANKACADGGICAADGTTLKQTLRVVVSPAPLVSFERAAYSVREGSSVAVVVRLTGAHQSAAGVTIPIVLDATASSASQADFSPDFTTVQGVTFWRGETSKTFRIQAATDKLVEAAETIVLGFGTLPGAIDAGSTSSTTVALTNATNPTITFSRVDGEVAEGGSASFTFKITNDVTFAADAAIDLTVGGSATAGTDFTLEDASGSAISAPYSVTFPAGQSSTSFTIRATDDSTAEPVKESVTIRATVVLTNASLGSRTVTIPPSDVANVPEVTITAGSSVSEGEAATFTLERTGSTTSTLTVSVRAVATGASLASAPSSVTFAAGSATASLSVPTRDDTVVRAEGGQVTAYLRGSSSNPPAYLTTPTNQATVAVDENDTRSWTVTPSAEELIEGRPLTLTVNTGGVTFPDDQTIELTLGGSAAAGQDYLLPGGCTGSSCFLTLRRGAREVRTTFRTLYDAFDEDDESIAIDAYLDDSWIGSVSVNLVNSDTPPPVAVGPVGGGSPGGGGGGGGSSGPTPSKADFEWTVKDDIEQLASGHDNPTGLWGDGDAVLLLENGSGADDAVYAYDIATGARVESREFELDERNRAPRGVASAGNVLWVADSGRDRLFAYDAATGERLPERDIVLAPGNRDPRGVWTDGKTIFVLNRNPSLYAYDPVSGDLLDVFGLDPANGDPRGLWSDGVTVWVSDHGAKQLFAYRLPAPDANGPAAEVEQLQRVRDEEFTELSKASNNSPRGIWSDGAVMYVADANDGRVYTYNMPDAIDARLASLVLAGVRFGEFSPLRTEYEGGAETGVEETTVEAVPAQARATVVIAPPDADGDSSEGYQVTLAGTREITVTVTSPDSSRTRVYRVALAGPEEPTPHARLDEAECLRGPVVAGGFSLVLAGGGGFDELAACAGERGVAALYVLAGGEWVSYILGAPDVVNGPFHELFPEGLPAGTPVVVRGGEPEAVAEGLTSLTLDGVSFGAFSPGRSEYAGVADESLTQATVEAVPAQASATVVIAPADADGDPANGHQVAVRAGAPVTVTVTSEDGARTAVYRVWIAGAGADDAEPAPECLRGDSGPGFSLVVHEGGSVAQIAACARSRGIVALYALADGGYVAYLPGAPDFFNEPFRELFPHGLPPGTPLVAAGGDGN